MITTTTTYSFSAEADRKSAHVRGLDAMAPFMNVTLVERLAR